MFDLTLGPPISAAPRLLQLGCGLCAPVEWVNLEGSSSAWLAQHPILKGILRTLHLLPRSQLDVPWPKNIQTANLTKPLPFPDSSFDAVYSSHTIEHLYRNEALGLLKEARRVLRPGGICRTLVPDLEALIKEYRGEGAATGDGTSHPDDPARQLFAKLRVRPELRRKGRLRGVYDAMNDLRFHKWMYDARSLTHLMTEAGFIECQRRGLHESRIPFLDKVEQRGRVLNGAGVAVEGVKPV